VTQPAAPSLAWRRLHPVTPLLRGWAVIAAFLFVLVQRSASGDGVGFLVRGGRWSALGVLVFVAVVGVAMWLSWRRAEYAYDDDSLYMRSGVLFRQHRSVRLDRVQAINVTKPLLARIFGLAQLTFEAAGGKGAHIQLGFLRDHEAEVLRAELLARAAGIHVAQRAAGTTTASGAAPAPGADGGAAAGTVVPPPAPAPVAPERQVLEVPPARVLGASLLSALTIVAVLVVAGLAVAVVVTRSAAPVLATVVPLVALVSGVFQQFSQRFGFTAAVSPDGIRVRHGLLQSVTQTIPPGRVQAVRVSQPLLWRMTGWWQVCINVAGYSDEDEARASSVLLPVGTPQEVALVLWLVVPELAREHDAALVAAGLHGRSSRGADPFVPAPRRTRWLDPVAWRRHGYAVTDRALLVRGGGLVRRFAVVPHERTQSLGVSQGPWQRRLRVASFHLHSTPGPVHPAVAHLREQDVTLLVREQARRAREARAVARPDSWMRPSPEPGR